MAQSQASQVISSVTIQKLMKSNRFLGKEAQFTAGCLASRTMPNLAVVSLDLTNSGVAFCRDKNGELADCGIASGSGLDFWPVRGRFIYHPCAPTHDHQPRRKLQSQRKIIEPPSYDNSTTTPTDHHITTTPSRENGERTQDPEDLLQEPRMRQAPAPQGHPVQGRQGFGVRAG